MGDLEIGATQSLELSRRPVAPREPGRLWIKADRVDGQVTWFERRP